MSKDKRKAGGRPRVFKEPTKLWLTLDKDMVRALDEIALDTGRNRSQIIREALHRYLTLRILDQGKGTM